MESNTPQEIGLKRHVAETIKLDLLDDEWIKIGNCHRRVTKVIQFYLPVEEIGKRYQFSKYILDLSKFRLRKVVRIVGMVLLFITKLRKKTMGNVYDNGLLKQFKFSKDKYLVTQRKYDLPFICQEGLVIELSEEVFVN